jgi:hypothetical protein
MTITLLDIPVIFGLSIEVYFIFLFIAIPTFFFWKWVLKKYIKVDKRRKIAAWAATLIATPLLYTSLVLLFVFGLPLEPRKNFNKQEWLTDREGRFEMSRDIIKSKILLGKDTSQVKDILGDPAWGSDTTSVWTYDMGFNGSGFGINFHHLNLTLDNSGKVTSVEHIKIRD